MSQGERNMLQVRRRIAGLGLICCLAASSSWAGTGPDLASAFVIAMGTRPPAIRHVEMPVSDTSGRRIFPSRAMTVSAIPDRLVSLGGTRWALVIGEVDEQGAHSTPGALSIAYLDRHDGAWTLDHLWPEIAFVGSSGKPANAGEEEHRFGRHKLFFARERWCGMGECSETIDAVALEDAGPVALNPILAGARFPAGTAPLDIDCAPYAVTATIGPPRSAAGLFSVTYAGWTAPEHRLQPRTPFRLTTDYVRDGQTLRMAPEIVVPECDR